MLGPPIDIILTSYVEGLDYETKDTLHVVTLRPNLLLTYVGPTLV